MVAANELILFLWTIEMKNLENVPELNQLIFGRTMNPTNDVGESVYEIILSIAGTKGLINLIWERFNLKEHPEILYQVSLE